MRSLATLVLAIAAYLPLSGAAQDWVVVNGLVAHLEGTYCNNRITKGLGYERASGSMRYSVGFYDNSNCNWSKYAAAAWLPIYFQSVNLRLGVIGGAVTGYRSAVTPAGGFAVTSEEQGYGYNFIFIPPMSSSAPGVFWMQAKVRW